MKAKIFLLLFISEAFLFHYAAAQKTFGAKLSGGISKISTSTGGWNNRIQENYFGPSGNAGLFFHFYVSSGSALIGVEVLFMQIEGREHEVIPIEDSPNYIGKFWIYDYDKHISYIGFPVYIGFNIKKLTLMAGLQTSFKVIAKTNYSLQSPITGSSSGTTDKFKFYHILPSPRVGIAFNLTNQLGIEASYHMWNNNRWNGQQMVLGVKYTLKQVMKKASE